MKKQLIILILCFSSFCYSQNEEKKGGNNILISNEETCEKGSEKANEDFSKGIFNSFSYGWAADTNPKDSEKFSEYYKEYVRKKYSINIEHKGCVISDCSECYSKTMDKLILDKFGKDVFKNARKEALALFAKRQ